MGAKTKKTTGAKGTAKKTAETMRAGKARGIAAAKKSPSPKSAPGSAQASRRTRGAVAGETVSADADTDEDLLRLRASTQSVFERLRDIDPDALPSDKTEEYWRDRHIARAAWEHAENAAFEILVDQQKQQLPVVSASNAKLAKDVETTATVIGVLNIVSASLGILASVITLLA